MVHSSLLMVNSITLSLLTVFLPTMCTINGKKKAEKNIRKINKQKQKKCWFSFIVLRFLRVFSSCSSPFRKVKSSFTSMRAYCLSKSNTTAVQREGDPSRSSSFFISWISVSSSDSVCVPMHLHYPTNTKKKKKKKKDEEVGCTVGKE